eukprot:2065871-Pleurochrysis_carterae.AAC.1
MALERALEHLCHSYRYIGLALAIITFNIEAIEVDGAATAVVCCGRQSGGRQRGGRRCGGRRCGGRRCGG